MNQLTIYSATSPCRDFISKNFTMAFTASKNTLLSHEEVRKSIVLKHLVLVFPFTIFPNILQQLPQGNGTH